MRFLLTSLVYRMLDQLSIRRRLNDWCCDEDARPLCVTVRWCAVLLKLNLVLCFQFIKNVTYECDIKFIEVHVCQKYLTKAWFNTVNAKKW